MIEVCVDSLEGAIRAAESGADRIELSEQLQVGGVSPSEQLIQAVRNAIQIPIIVLIRCRAGDFYFDSKEQKQMVADAQRAVELGANGIAIGGLTKQNELDLVFLKSLIDLQLPCEWVMHRAFDTVQDPKKGIEELVQLGFHRILTSGGPNHACEGIPALKCLVEYSAGRIEILPAGGIDSNNAGDILSLTGCNQLHGSFRSSTLSSGPIRLPDATTIQTVSKLIKALK